MVAFRLQGPIRASSLAGSVNAGGLEERLETVRAAMERAAARAGRNPSGIRLVAAVKSVAGLFVG